MATSFKQFNYCELCRISHTVAEKKHVYCKRHQVILRNILNKFRKKIEESSVHLTKPEAHDESWESGAKFWCYFCSKEIYKHFVLDSVSFASGGLLEHIASKEHETSAHNFWWKHRIDRSIMKHYLISKNKLEKFLDAIPNLKEEFLQKMRNIHEEQVSKLRKAEQQRRQILSESINSEYAEGSSQITNVANSLHTSTSSSLPEFTTATQQQKIPPWLMDDTPSEPPYRPSKAGLGFTSLKPIGPSIEDYQKHIEQERRKQLNPNRVGANFDHSSPTAEGWLPSFGRVWNNGRRWQSRQQYRKELKSKKQKAKQRNAGKNPVAILSNGDMG